MPGKYFLDHTFSITSEIFLPVECPNAVQCILVETLNVEIIPAGFVVRFIIGEYG